MEFSTRNLESYSKTCVKYTNGAAICMLCPSTISSQSKVEKDSFVLQSHFNKNHQQKPGFIYCGVCFKSVCVIGQEQQKSQHWGHPTHVANVARVGQTYEACLTCGTATCAAGHNKDHNTTLLQYAGEGEVEPETAENVLKKLTVEKFVSLILKSLCRIDKETLSIGSWCNEHFQKVFGVDYDHTPIKLGVVKKAECGVCSVVKRNFGDKIVIRDGLKLTVDDRDIRRHIVCEIDFAQKLAGSISYMEYIELSDEEMELYEFDKTQKRFVLDKVSEKKAKISGFFAEAHVNAANSDVGDEEHTDTETLD